MKELEQLNDFNMKKENNETKIYYQEDIDRIFDKILKTTEVILITHENPKYEAKINQPNAIRINLYNRVLKGSINLELLPNSIHHLKGLIIQNVPLNSLKGLPSELSSLRGITITNCPLENLKYIPNSLPNLRGITITSCNLTNLNYFPKINPNLLERLNFHHNQLTSLKGLPPELPKLKDFNVNHNNLTSLKYLPKMTTKNIWIEHNPLRTLFNVSEDLIKRFIDSTYQKTFALSPRGIQLINEYRVPFIDEFGNDAFEVHPNVLKNKIMKFYSKPISEIAEKYINHRNTITDDELDRLIWEADFEDRKFLEANLPNTDSILRKINKRLSIKLPSNLTLFK
ncbi:hypothetical protein DSAG12_04535 [Promethearchaeum syntrophicum]|uniref:Uncharacterized protein n=1 Tax=Promethearchaeum syntrophicum TaxID=2594042 RepID=A0AC61ZU46_9ARCH